MPSIEFDSARLIERLSERSLDFLENLISTCPGIVELRTSIMEVIKDDCDRYDTAAFVEWLKNRCQSPNNKDIISAHNFIIQLSEILIQTIDDIQKLASEVISLIPQAYTDDILMYSRRLAVIMSLVDAFIINIFNLCTMMISSLNKFGKVETIPQEIDLCIHSAACVINRLSLIRINQANG